MMRAAKNGPSHPRSQRPFGRIAKTLISMTATAALIGGWNWIAHIDSAKVASSQNTPAAAGQDIVRTALQTSAANAPQEPLWPSLQPLIIPPVPTLPPPPSIVAAPAIQIRNAAPTAPLFALPASAPLPTLAPLPAMPQLPPPPPSSMSIGVGGRTVSRGS